MLSKRNGLKGLWIGLAVALVLIAIYLSGIERSLLPQSSGNLKRHLVDNTVITHREVKL